MAGRELSLVLASLLSGACQERSQGAETAEEAVQITKDAFAEHSPQVNLNRFTTDAVDLGDRWRVVYDVPGGSTGTPVRYEVDKKSGEIVHAEGGQ